MVRKTKTVAVMAALLIAAAGVITFEACNKKNEVVNSIPQMPQKQGIVYLKDVPDRVAYTAEFKKKLQMQERSEEFLTVDNANAFLFDILNYDFGDIQENKDEILYETTTYAVNVANGAINLSDFASLYKQISMHVYDYYHSLNVVNPHYLYIYPKIEEFDANATTATVTVETALTSGYGERTIVFDSTLCDYFIYEPYQWDDAADTLEYYFNLQYPNISNLAPGRYFFSTPTPVGFYYEDYPDLYHCDNCTNNAIIYDDEMCELLNAYMDIADDYAYSHGGVYVMSCEIIPTSGYMTNGKVIPPLHHFLIVCFSTINTSPTGPNV